MAWTVTSRVTKTQSHHRRPPTFHPVSSGATTALRRTATTSAWEVGVLRAATRCSACTRPPGVIVSPKPVRRIVATFANGTPSTVCSPAAHASVDVRGHGPPRPRPVGSAGFATGPSRRRRRRAFGERRRLPLGSAPGGLQLVAQPVPLALEPVPLVAQLIALSLDFRLLALQPLDLAGLLPNAPRDLLARRVRQPPPC